MTPVENPKVTSVYGSRKSPITGKWETHHGIDMVDTKGNMNLRCIWDTVKTEYKTSFFTGGRGNTAYLYFSNTLRVLYQHCASFSDEILKGKAIPQGGIVGVMGTTGDSTGIHLHAEVQTYNSGRWTAIEPTKYLEIPNTLGIHTGNNNYDTGKPVVELWEYEGIVASAGDAKAIEGLLNSLSIQFVVKKV